MHNLFVVAFAFVDSLPDSKLLVLFVASYWLLLVFAIVTTF